MLTARLYIRPVEALHGEHYKVLQEQERLKLQIYCWKQAQKSICHCLHQARKLYCSLRLMVGLLRWCNFY